MTRLLLAAMLVVTGCCERGDLSITSEPDQAGEVGLPPLHLDLVLTAAQELCGKPLVGSITFVHHKTKEMSGPRDSGYCRYGDCGFDISVLREEPNAANIQAAIAGGYTPDRYFAAMNTSLAHEIGHYCLDVPDSGDDQCDEFAKKVNKRALDVLIAQEATP